MELRPQLQPAPAADRPARLPARAWARRAARCFVSVPTEYLMETMAHALPPAPALPSPARGRIRRRSPRSRGNSAKRKRPVIITEEAGRDPATVDALVALAETLGAPVAEAWQPYYVNFPRDHPLYAGVAVENMKSLVDEADAVLLAECVMPWHPPHRSPRRARRFSSSARTRCARTCRSGACAPTWWCRASFVRTLEAPLFPHKKSGSDPFLQNPAPFQGRGLTRFRRHEQRLDRRTS